MKISLKKKLHRFNYAYFVNPCRLRVSSSGEAVFIRTLACEYDRGEAASKEVLNWDNGEEEEEDEEDCKGV